MKEVNKEEIKFEKTKQVFDNKYNNVCDENENL
jgi:hypothetical protein